MWLNLIKCVQQNIVIMLEDSLEPVTCIEWCCLRVQKWYTKPPSSSATPKGDHPRSLRLSVVRKSIQFIQHVAHHTISITGGTNIIKSPRRLLVAAKIQYVFKGRPPCWRRPMTCRTDWEHCKLQTIRNQGKFRVSLLLDSSWHYHGQRANTKVYH